MFDPNRVLRYPEDWNAFKDLLDISEGETTADNLQGVGDSRKTDSSLDDEVKESFLKNFLVIWMIY